MEDDICGVNPWKGFSNGALPVIHGDGSTCTDRLEPAPGDRPRRKRATTFLDVLSFDQVDLLVEVIERTVEAPSDQPLLHGRAHAARALLAPRPHSRNAGSSLQ